MTSDSGRNSDLRKDGWECRKGKETGGAAGENFRSTHRDGGEPSEAKECRCGATDGKGKEGKRKNRCCSRDDVGGGGGNETETGGAEVEARARSRPG